MERTTVVYQIWDVAPNEAAIKIKKRKLLQTNKVPYLDLLGEGMWEYLLYMSKR